MGCLFRSGAGHTGRPCSSYSSATAPASRTLTMRRRAPMKRPVPILDNNAMRFSMSSGKKPPGQSDPEPEELLDEDGNPIWGPSRTQVRREASAVSDLALELVKLPKARVATMPLDEETREAIELCARLIKNARARQLRLVAKLLRGLGPEELKALQVLVTEPPGRTSDEHLYEFWRRRLLAEGDAVLGEFVAEYPNADRQHLRQLIRSAKRQPADARTAKAARQLLRAIRATASGEQTPPSEDDSSTDEV